MAEGSNNLTTYYAKRIIGDNAAKDAESALLQIGTGVTQDTWILNKTGRNYGILYDYDYTNSTQGNADKISFMGASDATAFVQLNTGDIWFSGQVYRDGVSSHWNNGRDNALFRAKTVDSYSPWGSIKTTNGSWDIGAYQHTSYTDYLLFSYIPDGDPSDPPNGSYNGANAATPDVQIRFTALGSITKLCDTGQLGSVSHPWNGVYSQVGYDSVPLDLTKGTIPNTSTTTYYNGLIINDKSGANGSNNRISAIESAITKDGVNYLFLRAYKFVANNTANTYLRLSIDTASTPTYAIYTNGKFTSEGSIICGTTTTASEINAGPRTNSGRIYLYSIGNNTSDGDRGLYIDGANKSIIKAANDGSITYAYGTFNGDISVKKAAGSTTIKVTCTGYTDSSSGADAELSCWMHIGSGKENHGIYSPGYATATGMSFTANARWLIYRNKDGDVIIPGATFSTQPVIKTGAATPEIDWMSTSSTARTGILYLLHTTKNSKRVADKFVIRQYSYDASTGETSANYENYYFPSTTAGLSDIAEYYIRTSKDSNYSISGASGYVSYQSSADCSTSNNGGTAVDRNLVWMGEKNGNGTTRIRHVQNTDGTTQTEIVARNYNSDSSAWGSWHGITIKATKSNTATYTVTDAANFRSAISALGTGGGTITGNLTIKKSAIDIKLDNNNVSSNTNVDYYFNDTNGAVSCLEQTYYTNGSVRIGLWLRNWKTASSAYTSWYGIAMTVTKADAVSWSVSGASSFCSAISALPLGGGTMTGILTLKGSQYSGPSGAYAMDANNSDIIKVNGIYTNDDATTWGEGFCFYRTATTWDAMVGHSGTFYFSSGKAYDAAVSNANADANIRAGKVYCAVWNDYAEFRKTNKKAKPGQVVVDKDDGSLIITTKRLQTGTHVVTDTYGFSIGETDETQTPVAVSGRVLVYPYRAREEYHAGMAVCSAPDGTVDIMSRDEIMLYPDAIVGIVSEIPTYEEWGSDHIKVNNRIWIKVK